MSNIVVCSDGTGNAANKGRGTNVFKLYEAVDVNGHLNDPSLVQQFAIYDDGVGTQKLKVLRLLAGAFGFGLARNVRQLYAEVARCYEEGANLYLFGFSRGAFTARTLAGFINKCGIVDPAGLTSGQLSQVVSDEYRRYRKEDPALLERLTTPVTTGLLKLWRSGTGMFRPKTKTPTFRSARIRFIGVWDTVDAVGFPILGVAALWNRGIHRFKFSNRRLPPNIDQAAHALAIDEERASFSPLLWEADNRVEQVWFPGVHSNVGGGYPKQGISHVALHWMMTKAEEASVDPSGSHEPSQSEDAEGSLRFLDGPRTLYRSGRNAFDYLYDSRSGSAIYYRYRPRDIEDLCKIDEGGSVPVRVHQSAVDRIEKRPQGYAPGNLPDAFDVVSTQKGAPIPSRISSKAAAPPSNSVTSPFDGASRWIRSRQVVQGLFYAAQVSLIATAWRTAPGASWERPASEVGQWLLPVAEAAVAPIPGTFVQSNVVHSMFANPYLGIAFLAVFPLCYALGLGARVRLESINSETWRRFAVAPVPTSNPATPSPVRLD